MSKMSNDPMFGRPVKPGKKDPGFSRPTDNGPGMRKPTQPVGDENDSYLKPGMKDENDSYLKPGGPKPFKPTTGGPMPKFQMPGGTNVIRNNMVDKNTIKKQAIQKKLLGK